MGSNVEFKVGDRVRRVKRDHSSGRGLCVGQEGVIGGVSDMFSGQRFKIEGEEDQLAHDPDNLELVTPATWAPVEGKYGKTRDGRKVGPMVRHAGLQPWQGEAESGTSRGYEHDGRWMPGETSGQDLVAEWVEPATGASPVEYRRVPTIKAGKFNGVTIRPYGRSAVYVEMGGAAKSEADLTAAIATLTTVRDALREVA